MAQLRVSARVARPGRPGHLDAIEWSWVEGAHHLGRRRRGLAQADVFDEHGLVGRTAQALLVRPAVQK